MLFIREHEKKHFVHCLDCARRHSSDLKGFVCLLEYQLKELKEVYTNFKLTSQNPIPNMANAAAAQRYQQAAHNSQTTLSKSPVAAVANHPMMAGSSLASTMINSMASMTPQQQLALQQVCHNFFPYLECCDKSSTFHQTTLYRRSYNSRRWRTPPDIGLSTRASSRVLVLRRWRRKV